MTTHLWIAFWSHGTGTTSMARLALMTDDCVWEVTRGREPHGTLYTGRADVRAAIDPKQSLPAGAGNGWA